MIALQKFYFRVEILLKKNQIETAFRACKEAFAELSSAYINMLENKSQQTAIAEMVSKRVGEVVNEALTVLCDRVTRCMSEMDASWRKRLETANAVLPYATVAASEKSRVRDAPPGALETTNLIVTLREDFSARYKTSRETKDTFQKIIKPADFNLKVNRISLVRNNGVRIEARSVDLTKMTNSRELHSAGLKLEQEGKLNPRLLIRGVPCTLTRDEIKTDLIDLNLANLKEPQIKVVYIFPQIHNRRTTNCVIEVSPDVRAHLLRDRFVYVNYFACEISDYVRVLQCFKCLAFGHFAKHCRFKATCGHCAGEHKTKECTNREATPVCGNCRRWQSQTSHQHSALDDKKCPILRRRISDRTSSINYG